MQLMEMGEIPKEPSEKRKSLDERKKYINEEKEHWVSLIFLTRSMELTESSILISVLELHSSSNSKMWLVEVLLPFGA